MILKFDNTYSKLPGNFYQRVNPQKASGPKLLYFNTELADTLNIEYDMNRGVDIAQMLSGNVIPNGAEPIALAYAGHQFGYFAPQLGDGRAILLGEILNKNNERFDIQLKGSGITAYSRRGDGRAALAPVLREYIISRGMYNLGVKTTQPLAAVSTGEQVLRSKGLTPGAILTRIAKSHIRIGTFEYFASRSDVKSLKILADYTINRHYPEIKDYNNPYAELFKLIQNSQIELIVQWMRLGFIHGVMNTDNTSIAGETLDYGPCAFLDEYNPDKTFSSIDFHGRYRFSAQPSICLWNLTQLARCLAFIMEDNAEKGIDSLNSTLNDFESSYQLKYNNMMCQKIGIGNANKEALGFLTKLLDIMSKESLDYTLTFRYLTYILYDKKFDYSKIYKPSVNIENWAEKWLAYLQKENSSLEMALNMMLKVNPAVIPRNHLIEEALDRAALYNDFTKVDAILKALSEPYSPSQEKNNPLYTLSPRINERVLQTFCGT